MMKIEASSRLYAATSDIPKGILAELKNERLPATKENAVNVARKTIKVCKYFGDTKSKQFREAQAYLLAVDGIKKKPIDVPLDPDLQVFVVQWVEEFGKGSKTGTVKLFKRLAELELEIPTKLKKATGILYRGFRMPILDFNLLLTGEAVTLQSPYLSFSTDVEVAESFAAQDAKNTVGVVIKHPAKRVVLNIGKVYSDLATTINIRTKHFDDLANFENEVIVDNSHRLQVDAHNIMKVYLNWKDLSKLHINKSQRDQLERMDGLEGIVVPFTGKIPRLLRIEK